MVARTIAGLLLALGLGARAEADTYLFVSGGEAHFLESSDQSESAIVPQAGVQWEYRWRFLSPYSETSIGYYNHGWIFEQFVGLYAGPGWREIRAGLTAGVGIQTANDKDFLGIETDTYRLDRKVYTPFGFGLRADVFRVFYGEWEVRVPGHPWWKLELGYRLGSIGELVRAPYR